MSVQNHNNKEFDNESVKENKDMISKPAVSAQKFFPKKNHVLFAGAIVIVMLLTGGYFYFSYFTGKLRTDKENDLKAISALKTTQLDQWRKERIADVKIITESRFFANGIEEWLTNKNSGPLSSDVLEQLQSVASSNNYENIFLVSANGELLLSVDPDLNQIDNVTKAKLTEVSGKNEIAFTGLYFCPQHNTIHYDIIAPVINRDNNVIANLVFRINPYDYLYPLIQSWPTPSKTAELLLVRMDGDSVLFLNELRHQKNTALQLRISMTNGDLPAAQALSGNTGIFYGKDYREKKVISCLARVPETNWFLITKVDKSEIFAEIYYRGILSSLLILLLILTLTFGFAWIYKHRQQIIYKKLWQIQEEYRTMLYSIGDAVITTDTHGCVMNMNKVAETLTGWKEPEATGQKLTSVFKIINDVTGETAEDITEKVLQERKITGLANHRVLISKHGTEYQIAESTAPIKDEKGIVNGVILVFSDVTEKYNAQKQLLAAKEKAEESDRLKSAFLANMSHEIRTPMNGILGFAGILKNSQLKGEDQKRFIEIIEAAGKRMLNIINDIINISKIEAGQIKPDIQDSNINEQNEYIYTFFKPEAEAKGIQLSFKNALPSAKAFIKTDREKVYAIMTNLVKNAIKFTDQGSIEFGYEKKGNNIEFFVKDSGIGIPGNQREVIFERFAQVDIEHKMARQGAGLGLAISKAYAEMLGGKIWVDSEEGKGSAFYFTIPCIEANIAETDKIIDTGKSSVNLGLKVIIAEDDQTSGQFLSILMDKYCKEIIYTSNGTETVEACRMNPDTDLVLIDIQMPYLNGYEATRQIRKFNKDVIIIAQTAYGLKGDKEKAVAAGCNDYIPKPVDTEELYALITKYFNPGEEAPK